MKLHLNMAKELNEFTKATERGQFDRIPYKAWQRLNQIAKHEPQTEAEITVNHQLGQYIVWLYPTMDAPITMEYCFGDTSFEPFRKFIVQKYMDEDTKKLTMRKEKENTTMNIKPNINFDFGPVNDDSIRLSPYGLAVRNAGQWVTYNATSKQTVDVTGFVFDFGKFIYKMPVAVKDVKIGDMILHQGKPVYVTDIDEDTSLYVVDILASENKNVIPVTNMFGFNFVTKIVSLMNLGGDAPSADQPFGNIMPMLVWSSILGDGNGDGDFFGDMSMEKLMMLSMLTGQSNPFGTIMNLGGMFGSTAPTQG